MSPRRETPAARGFLSEALAIGLMAFAVLLVLSLASYHADDPVPWPIGQWAGEPVSNVAGITGALCAYLLLDLFGYAGWTIPLLLVLLGWEVFWRRGGRALSRAAGCMFLVVSAAATLHLLVDDGGAPGPAEPAAGSGTPSPTCWPARSTAGAPWSPPWPASWPAC